MQPLVSNGGEGALQLIEVSKEGKLKSLGKAEVGKGPRQFAFPAAAGRRARVLPSGSR